MVHNLTKSFGKYFITFGTIPPTYVHDVWGLCLVLSSFVFEEERACGFKERRVIQKFMDNNSELDKVLGKYFITFGTFPFTYVLGFVLGPDFVIYPTKKETDHLELFNSQEDHK